MLSCVVLCCAIVLCCLVLGGCAPLFLLLVLGSVFFWEGRTLLLLLSLPPFTATHCYLGTPVPLLLVVLRTNRNQPMALQACADHHLPFPIPPSKLS